MMKQLPLISIIIPTYKRAKYLGRAINSALNQSYPNIEVIVVDDNKPESDDRIQTELVMKYYSENPKVYYIRHKKNKNGAAARNTGIANSHGKYICFLDDDDWYLPEKVEKQFEFLQKHKEFKAVYCGYERAERRKIPSRNGDLSFELLSGVEIIYTNTIMMEYKSAVACGGWDERFQRNQEAVFLLRYFSIGEKIGALPEVLVKFDISDDSNRSRPKQFEKDFEFFLEVHESTISALRVKYPDAREMIYSYRFRGVLINYIKYGYWKEAVRLYCKMVKMLPGRFQADCICYVKRRLLKQPLFKEFEEG